MLTSTRSHLAELLILVDSLLTSSHLMRAQKFTKPMPAKLPEQLRPKPRPSITTMAADQEWWILSTDMLITKSWDCYLNPNAKQETHAFNRLRVRRDQSGYHVVFADTEVALAIHDLPPKY